VLVVRVHREILHSEAIPDAPHHDSKIWDERYRSIRDLERHLHTNGTRVVKIFLHLSKEEQRQRFLSRIDEPDKNWKFSAADVEERKFWKQYRRAYEECLSATSTDDSPWFVVPADDKENARLIVSRIVVDTLDGLGMSYPAVTAERAAELQAIRAELVG
jgi:polyphosphate kinase 2 (PPK2 family)